MYVCVCVCARAFVCMYVQCVMYFSAMAFASTLHLFLTNFLTEYFSRNVKSESLRVRNESWELIVVRKFPTVYF